MFAELDITSNFTFLTGASHPEEYIDRAALLGLPAIAIADENSVAGIVRAHTRARRSPGWSMNARLLKRATAGSAPSLHRRSKASRPRARSASNIPG